MLYLLRKIVKSKEVLGEQVGKVGGRRGEKRGENGEGRKEKGP